MYRMPEDVAAIERVAKSGGRDSEDVFRAEYAHLATAMHRRPPHRERAVPGDPGRLAAPARVIAFASRGRPCRTGRPEPGPVPPSRRGAGPGTCWPARRTLRATRPPRRRSRWAA